MAKFMEIYKCELCGNIIEVVHEGVADVVCCGVPMRHMAAGSVDAAQEKHVPVLEKKDGGWLVKVGSVTHPSTPEHYIEWIELILDGRVCRAQLKPGDVPEAFFAVNTDKVTAREYCNLHGLWKAES